MRADANASAATLAAMRNSAGAGAAAGAGPGGRGRRPDGLPAMEVRNLHFAYGANPILKGVDLCIETGKVTTIMGANGCGKSTLFNVMTKNLEQQRGKVFLRGKNIRNMSLKDFSKRVSIVHQYNSASADITVGQLVEMGRTPYQKPMSAASEEDERVVEWALEVTGISEFKDREVSRLSGGQRQRVWIAMALAQNTKVLFLDEPTTYLDIRYQIEILDLVRKLNREYGITIVMVLHDINQALYYSDVIIGLAGGKVAACGAPADVVTRQSVRELFGIELAVTEVDGRKYVLLRDGEAPATDGEAPATADDAPATADDAPATADDAPATADEAAVAAAGNLASAGESAGARQADPAAAGSEDQRVSEETLRAMHANAAAAAGGADAKTSVRTANRNVSAETLAAMRANGFEPCAPEGAAADGAAAGAAAADGGEPQRKEPARSTSKVARVLWTVLGVVAFGLGTLGVILPVLPTAPLYLAALFCFAKGSQRLHDWFVSTSLYHKHLESFVDHRGMTTRTKLSIMGTVTVVMGIAFALMGSVPVGRVILVAVWVFHVVFFVFFVKTDKGEGAEVG